MEGGSVWGIRAPAGGQTVVKAAARSPHPKTTNYLIEICVGLLFGGQFDVDSIHMIFIYFFNEEMRGFMFI